MIGVYPAVLRIDDRAKIRARSNTILEKVFPINERIVRFFIFLFLIKSDTIHRTTRAFPARSFQLFHIVCLLARKDRSWNNQMYNRFILVVSLHRPKKNTRGLPYEREESTSSSH